MAAYSLDFHYIKGSLWKCNTTKKHVTPEMRIITQLKSSPDFFLCMERPLVVKSWHYITCIPWRREWEHCRAEWRQSVSSHNGDVQTNQPSDEYQRQRLENYEKYNMKSFKSIADNAKSSSLYSTAVNCIKYILKKEKKAINISSSPVSFIVSLFKMPIV